MRGNVRVRARACVGVCFLGSGSLVKSVGVSSMSQ